MTRHQEIERKFDVDPATPFPDLSGANAVLSEAAESQLDATYFDTVDAQLARHQITLRRRTGGSDAGWHLKLPAGQDQRTEVRLPLGRATRKVPAALTREVRALVRDRPLVPIATMHTTRIERQLMDTNGNALATLADDTVHAERLTGDTDEVSSWREIEVELVEGDLAFLDTVGRRLLAAGLTPSGSSSKLARLLGDLAASTRTTGPGHIKAGQGTAGAVLLGHLQEQVDRLVLYDRDARAEASDGVHRMRVTTRRLRSALGTYQRLLDRARTDPVRDELKWLGQVLGRSRDTEVLHGRLRDLVATQPPELVLGPVRRRIDLELRKRHRVARAELLAALESHRYFRLLDALDDVLADPPFTARADKSAHKQVPHLVGRAVARVDRAARDVANATTTQARDEGLHEVRKSAKRARYAAESAAPLVGKPARKLAQRMTELQEVLGEHQDSVAARALLLELAAQAHQAGENGFTFGLLHAQEHTHAENARRGYGPALGKASTAKIRRWTR